MGLLVGYPRPMPLRSDRTARVVAYLPRDTADDVARLAAHDGVTTSAWAARILSAAVRSLKPRLELPTAPDAGRNP